jgi:hypothetical protein
LVTSLVDSICILTKPRRMQSAVCSTKYAVQSMQYKVCSTKYAVQSMRVVNPLSLTRLTPVSEEDPQPVHSREEEDPRPVHSRTCFQSRRPVHRICSPTRMCVLLSLAPTPHAHSPQMSLRASAAELFLSGQSHVRTSAYRARSCSRHV